MDSLAAAPGTGPSTSPLPVLRRSSADERFRRLPAGRTLVMGILNVTPDSFSDGGRFATVDDAVAAGLDLVRAGADIVDVGGESTRPDAERISPAQEQRRVLPVITALAAAGVTVSVDTMNVETAEKALAAGAVLINDVSGAAMAEGMPELVARTGAHYVLMHSRGPVRRQDPRAVYEDAPAEVLDELRALRRRLLDAGVAAEKIILDPGLGFSKTADHDWALLHALDRFTAEGHRVLVGASRKRFLGTLPGTDGPAVPAQERDAATTAVSALSAAAGAWCVRVHDVASSAAAVRVAAAWREGGR